MKGSVVKQLTKRKFRDIQDLSFLTEIINKIILITSSTNGDLILQLIYGQHFFLDPSNFYINYKVNSIY